MTAPLTTTMTKEDTLDALSAATERAIVSLGDALADGLAHGYAKAAATAEAAAFPVRAASQNSLLRAAPDAPSPTRRAAPEAAQEVVADAALAARVDDRALERAYEEGRAAAAATEARAGEERQPAARARALPSFRSRKHPPRPPRKLRKEQRTR